MIYLLYGTDTIKSRKKLHTLLDSMFTKKPNASFVRVEAGEFEENMLKEFVGGQGLFTNKYIIFFDNLFTMPVGRQADKIAKEVLLKSLKSISESENIFIFLEGKLNKAELNKFEKYAEKMQIFELRSLSSKFKFDIFSLANALGKRDKKNLWVLYQKAKLNNIADEQIHGILFWKIKSLILSSRSDKYSQEELKKLSNTLVSLYHDVRKGVHEMDSAMERFILGI